MGALPKQTVEYFPHFVRVGVTRRVLEAQYGNDGYAFWYKLLETLCTNKGHVFDFSHNLSRLDFLTFVHMGEDKALEILNLLAFDLGVIDKNLWATKRVIWSQNLVDYLAPVYKKRAIKEKPSRPLSAPARSGYAISDTGNGSDKPIPAPDMAFPAPEIPEVKEREERERERYACAHPPTLLQVEEFCKTRKSQVNPKRFHAYYEARNWQAAGRPILDWQAQVLYWETLETHHAPDKPLTATGVKLSFDSGIERAEAFHQKAMAGGVCCYCGHQQEFYPGLDGATSTIPKPCECQQYQDEFKKAVNPAPADSAAAK